MLEKIFTTGFRILLGFTIIAALSLLVVLTVFAMTNLQSIFVLLLMWIVPAYMVGAGFVLLAGSWKKFMIKEAKPVRSFRDVEY